MQQSNYCVKNAEECLELGRQIGSFLCHLTKPLAIFLHGDLGAGKTTFCKGAIEKLTTTPSELITSPTFTYVREYEHTPTVCHFDLYRISDVDDFIAMGFDEVVEESISFIEWPKRLEGWTTSIPSIDLFFNHRQECREIHFKDNAWNYLKKLQH